MYVLFTPGYLLTMELTDSEAKQLAALLIFLHLIVGHQSTAGEYMIMFSTVTPFIFNPQCMRRRVAVYVCVYMSVGLSVCLYMSKVRRYAVSCKICIVWTLLTMLRSGDMASFTCRDDWRFSSFLTKHTPTVLDTITNGTVYELLAQALEYSN